MLPTTILPFNEDPACVKCGGNRIGTRFDRDRAYLDAFVEFPTRRCSCGYTWHEQTKDAK